MGCGAGTARGRMSRGGAGCEGGDGKGVWVPVHAYESDTLRDSPHRYTPRT